MLSYLDLFYFNEQLIKNWLIDCVDFVWSLCWLLYVVLTVDLQLSVYWLSIHCFATPLAWGRPLLELPKTNTSSSNANGNVVLDRLDQLDKLDSWSM